MSCVFTSYLKLRKDKNDANALYHFWLGSALGEEAPEGEQVPPAVSRGAA